MPNEITVTPKKEKSNEVQYYEKVIAESNGVFDVHMLIEHYEKYGPNSGPLTTPHDIKGLKEYLSNEIRRLNMKHSVATSNVTRYLWLCQHYVKDLNKQADPNNYHVFPFGQFWYDVRFYLHFFATFFNFIANRHVQFSLTIVLMYYLHKWSHELYMIPLPWIGVMQSCVSMPVQYHCEMLSTIQANTFNGLRDMHKTIVTFVLSYFVAKMTTMLGINGVK